MNKHNQIKAELQIQRSTNFLLQKKKMSYGYEIYRVENLANNYKTTSLFGDRWFLYLW